MGTSPREYAVSKKGAPVVGLYRTISLGTIGNSHSFIRKGITENLTDRRILMGTRVRRNSLCVLRSISGPLARFAIAQSDYTERVERLFF